MPVPLTWEPFAQFGFAALFCGVLLYYFIGHLKDLTTDRRANEAAVTAERKAKDDLQTLERQAHAEAHAEDRRDVARTLKAIATTMLTFQQMTMVLNVTRGGKPSELDCDECKMLNRSMEVLNRLFESQRQELVRIFETT